MKKHSKVGNRPQKPGYRTPSTFRNKKIEKVHKKGHNIRDILQRAHKLR